jgi:thioredoxin-related protein
MRAYCSWLRMVVIAVYGLAFLAGPAVAQEIQWRHDYNAARKEARETNRPIIIDFGTTDCIWCKKLDVSTFRDPAVVQTLNERFIPLKINAEQNPSLAQALEIHSFPTLVFATAEGKILSVNPGFVDAARLSQQLQHTLTESRTAAPAAATGCPTESPGPMVEPACLAGARGPAAQNLLALAKQDYDTRQFLCCLERCRFLAVSFGDLPEGEEGRRLAAKIKSDPNLARLTCDSLADRLGELYLELADQCLRLGQAQQATQYLEQVLKVCPNSPHAQAAYNTLAQVQPGMAGPNEPLPKTRAQAP